MEGVWDNVKKIRLGSLSDFKGIVSLLRRYRSLKMEGKK